MTRDTFDRFATRGRGLFGDNEHAPESPTRSARSDIVDLTLQMLCEKPLAIAVKDPAKRGNEWIWLPKSQIEFESKGKGVVVVSLPRGLAEQKGLV
jgi:hypothetical protein